MKLKKLAKVMFFVMLAITVTMLMSSFSTPITAKADVTDDMDASIKPTWQAFEQVYSKIIMPVLLGIAGMVAVIAGAMLGIKIYSSGSPEESDKVKKQLKNWIIGIGIVVIALTLPSLLMEVLISKLGGV